MSSTFSYGDKYDSPGRDTRCRPLLCGDDVLDDFIKSGLGYNQRRRLQSERLDLPMEQSNAEYRVIRTRSSRRPAPIGR